ncbi:hypothetical protein PUF88_04950 [Lactobacillaceae bacterium L1_55_11]|nr:hypothetical protein [Lactobacillaceae bacterium L1_55_11]
MGLNYNLGDVQKQVEQSNQICAGLRTELTRSLTQLKQIDQAVHDHPDLATPAIQQILTTFYPLAQAIYFLCGEIIEQNQLFLQRYQAEVAQVAIEENEVRQQLQALRQLRDLAVDAGLEDHSSTHIIDDFLSTENQLIAKLQNLYNYNQNTATNFQLAHQLLSQLDQSFSQLAQVPNGQLRLAPRFLKTVSAGVAEQDFRETYHLVTPHNMRPVVFHKYLTELQKQAQTLTEMGWTQSQIQDYFDQLEVMGRGKAPSTVMRIIRQYFKQKTDA